MTERLGIAPGDVYPIGWPFTHIGGASIAMAVLRGRGLIVLFDSFDQTTFGDDVAEVGPTILGSGIPFFRAYLDAQRRHREDGPLYPTLRALTAGGAPTPPELIQELTSTFGVKGVGNAWGLTEFPIACCADAEVDPPEKLAVSVGRPSPGVEVRVVDGELRLKGPQCFLGYMDPTLDGSVFDEEGWLRTGDAGEVDSDGFVTITGRIKDVIIRNGENISPLEIEDVLLRHPDVQDVAVIGIPDQRTGERVVAIIVPHPGATIDLVMVRDHFTSEGVARQKTPEQVELTAEIARNPMGKAKKDEMRRALLSTGSARADLN